MLTSLEPCPLFRGRTFLTAKGFVPPLLGLATSIGALSGELSDGLAKEGVSSVSRAARVLSTCLTKGIHIQKVYTAAEGSAEEDLITKILK